MKIDFWGHKRKKKRTQKGHRNSAELLLCDTRWRNVQNARKIGQRSIFLGQKGSIGLASEEALAGNRNGKARNSKRPFPKRPDFFKIDISNRL